MTTSNTLVVYLLSKVEYMGIPTDDLYQTAYTDINTSLGVFDNLDALRAKVNQLEGKVVLWPSSEKSQRFNGTADEGTIRWWYTVSTFTMNE
jgi:hypothetical protein